MHFEPSRRRREVAPFTINLLRLVGWRFSFSRAAWVHRLGKGRHGPVFVVRDDGPPPRPHPAQAGFEAVSAAEDAVTRAEAAVSAAAASAASREGEATEGETPLPRRRPQADPPQPDLTTNQPAPAQPAATEEDQPIRPEQAGDPVHGDAAPRPGQTTDDRASEDERARWKVDGRPVQPKARPAHGRSAIAPPTRANNRASA